MEIPSLTIKGFLVGAGSGKMKKNGSNDVCIIVSDRPCTAAGVFTKNQVVGEPVTLNRRTLPLASHRAIVANSKYSNVCTGTEGLRNAEEMAARVAAFCKCAPEEVFVASTGIIGQQVPMEKMRVGIDAAWKARKADAWLAGTKAIMTTDTYPKLVRHTVMLDNKKITIGGMAKGSGMIHPDMATMLSFIATDASIEKTLLQEMLGRVVDRTFNCTTIDGDTSTSDMMIVLANGAAENSTLTQNGPQAQAFETALEAVATDLAREIARDGEGAEHLITVNVSGARSVKAAKQVANTIAISPLVKTAIAGRDANWGRFAMAAGRSGVPFSQNNLTIRCNDFLLFEKGQPKDFDEPALTKTLHEEEVVIDVEIGTGKGTATVWTCDLTHDYISINANYRT